MHESDGMGVRMAAQVDLAARAQRAVHFRAPQAKILPEGVPEGIFRLKK